MRGKATLVVASIVTVLFALSLTILLTGIQTQAATAQDAEALDPQLLYTQRIGTPKGVFFVDADHGWGAIGASSQFAYRSSLLFRTTNGGGSWIPQSFDGTVGLPFFIDQNRGWLVVETFRDDFWDWHIERTVNGGETWTRLTLGSCAPGFSIWFLDANHGWWWHDQSLCRTVDGGQTWEYLDTQSFSNLEVLRFVNANVGYARGFLDSTGSWELLRSTDGGRVWQVVGALPAEANKLWVAPQGDLVWAVGSQGRAWRSIDGGVTWIQAATPTTNDLHTVRFADRTRGWATSVDGVLLRSDDGGRTWTERGFGAPSYFWLMNAGPDHVWVYSEGLWRSRDGGDHWSALPVVDSTHLRFVQMGSLTTGWSGSIYQGLLFTADGGQRWQERAAIISGYAGFDAISAQRAWMAQGQQIARTNDGGLSWTSVTLPVYQLTDIDFVDASRGWAIGQEADPRPGCESADSQIFRTTDGGATWVPQIGVSAPWLCQNLRLERVVFADQQHGWVQGTIGSGHVLILRTSDGGATWSQVFRSHSETYATAGGMDFVSATEGWLAMNVCYGPFYCYEGNWKIHHTTDGGVTWQEQADAPHYGSVSFANASEGWVVGRNGRIAFTENGGATWQHMTNPLAINLNAVHAVAPGKAWIAGDFGSIFHYSTSPPAGCWSTPTPLPTPGTAPAPAGNIDKRVAHCVDDAYERVDTEELLYNVSLVRMGARSNGAVPYVSALLFRGLNIPRGATITTARIELDPWGFQNGSPIVVSIAGENTNSATDFNPANTSPLRRIRTQARVPWTIGGTVNQITQSPDVAPIIQEIVSRAGWQPGNNLALLIDFTPTSQFYIDWIAYESMPQRSARLLITYETTGTPTATTTPTSTATATTTPTRTAQPTNTATATSTPTPTRTAMPSATATPTPTTVHREVHLPLIFIGR